MSRFEGLKQTRAVQRPIETAAAPVVAEPVLKAPAASSRAGKKAVVGHFSPAVRRGLHQLAVDNDSNIQALLGEAIDDLMRKYGKHPFGER